MTENYDVLIVGGGMVGATMAYALSPLPLRIGVIEAVPFKSESQPSYDDRAIALAHGSAKVFEAMGLWPLLVEHVSPIKKIHVSDRGHFGVTRIDSSNEGVDALGYVIENRLVGRVLGDELPILGNVELICPATVTAITTTGNAAQLSVDCGGVMREVSAKLVIAADGGNSAVRNLLNIPTRAWDYGQSAVIANVTPERHHQNVAYERFTDSGPVAMLPNSSSDDPSRCSLVWTVRREDEKRVLGLSDEEFLCELQTRFGYRLGELRKVGRRNSYPLRLVRAKEHVRPRLALIGNAAHTLHPIAGQGFNLGLRDIAALAQVVAEAHAAGLDIGAAPVLNQYAEWRNWDHRKVIGFTDTLARLFSNPLAPVALVRNAGLIAVDLLPPLKRILTRQTMGMAGKLPRLAMGLPLLRNKQETTHG
jgi:2-octaprenyl-6-methoxyphenol hydroxylase